MVGDGGARQLGEGTPAYPRNDRGPRQPCARERCRCVLRASTRDRCACSCRAPSDRSARLRCSRRRRSLARADPRCAGVLRCRPTSAPERVMCERRSRYCSSASRVSTRMRRRRVRSPRPIARTRNVTNTNIATRNATPASTSGRPLMTNGALRSERNTSNASANTRSQMFSPIPTSMVVTSPSRRSVPRASSSIDGRVKTCLIFRANRCGVALP